MVAILKTIIHDYIITHVYNYTIKSHSVLCILGTYICNKHAVEMANINHPEDICEGTYMCIVPCV